MNKIITTNNHQITQRLFKVEGKPLVIPPRFRPLFDAIFLRKHDRVNVIAPTQDGKSLTIAAAVVPVIASEPERFTIVAPSEKKANIIMSEIIDFATQNPIIASQLELDSSNSLDRLRRERSKRQLTFKGGGGVLTLTLDAKNTKDNFKSAMGFGSKNIIADEAGLVDDPLWSTVVRMLGGDFKDDKRRKILIKIGNPFFRNHFYKSSKSSRYLQVFHNYEDSIRDYENGFYGYSPDYIEEMREEAFFDVFYECKFPDEDLVDSKGYRQLVKDSNLKVISKEEADKIEKIGIPKLGVDIGGGGDYNTFIMRYNNIAFVASKNRSKDTMSNVSEIERLLEEYKDLRPENINIDDIGIGRGVSDRLKEKGISVNGIAVGSTENVDSNMYSNLKAKLSWEAGKWLKSNLLVEEQISYKSVWEQCCWIKYKVNSDKQIKIEPKDELKKRVGKSPDFYEGLMLSFYEPPFIGIV